jgi:hypothetical protein
MKEFKESSLHQKGKNIQSPGQSRPEKGDRNLNQMDKDRSAQPRKPDFDKQSSKR